MGSKPIAIFVCRDGWLPVSGGTHPVDVSLDHPLFAARKEGLKRLINLIL